MTTTNEAFVAAVNDAVARMGMDTVAFLLRVSIPTVYWWCNDQNLPAPEMRTHLTNVLFGRL